MHVLCGLVPLLHTIFNFSLASDQKCAHKVMKVKVQFSIKLNLSAYEQVLSWFMLPASVQVQITVETGITLVCAGGVVQMW